MYCIQWVSWSSGVRMVMLLGLCTDLVTSHIEHAWPEHFTRLLQGPGNGLPREISGLCMACWGVEDYVYLSGSRFSSDLRKKASYQATYTPSRDWNSYVLVLKDAKSGIREKNFKTLMKCSQILRKWKNWQFNNDWSLMQGIKIQSNL